MLDTQQDYRSILKLWEGNEKDLITNWKYENLLKIVNEKLKFFTYHPTDIGLKNRNRKNHSFKFDFLELN